MWSAPSFPVSPPAVFFSGKKSASFSALLSDQLVVDAGPTLVSAGCRGLS